MLDGSCPQCCTLHCVLLTAEHFTSLKQQHSVVLQTTQEQKNLITQLEGDLGKVQPFLPHNGAGGDGEDSPSGIPSSAVIMSEALRGSTSSSGGGVCMERTGGAESLLPIVTSQRERFRQRNTELEAVSVYVCVCVTVCLCVHVLEEGRGECMSVNNYEVVLN